MPDFRAHTDTSSAVSTGELALSAEESHHLVVVNRARVGDPVIAFNGNGTEWTTQLAVAHKSSARLQIVTRIQHPALPFDVTLVQALPKGPGMDGIVRKATEIGARRIIPLASERSQVHLDGERQDRKREKWQTAALEAAKQCGNPWLPEIAPMISTKAFLEGLGPACEGELRLVACLHPETRGFKEVLSSYRARHGGAKPARVLWLIGPEGDFSPEEVAAATARGFAPITLGSLVLRCETAATYALAVSTYELRES